MQGKLSILFAIWLLQVVNYIDRVVVGFAGPSMMKSLAIDPQMFGIVLSSFAFGYFLSQIPGGIIADRWGARIVFVAGPLLWALLTGMTGLVTSVATLILVRFCFGLAEGVSNASTFKVVGDNFAEKERSRVVGLWVTAFALAPALTGPLVGWLLTSFGWQTVFVMVAIPALVVAAVNYRCIPADKPKPIATAVSAERPPSYREVLREPTLWLIAGAYGLWNIAYWGFLGWMPSYLALERHIDMKSAGLLGGLPYLFGLVGGVVSGLLGGGPLLRYRPLLLAGTYLCAGLALYFAFASSTLASSVTALSAAGFFIYAGLSTYGVVVIDLAPAEARAAYCGTVSTAGQVGAILAPAVIGYLVSETGSFGSGFAFMSVALCVGAVCAVALVPFQSARRLHVRAA